MQRITMIQTAQLCAVATAIGVGQVMFKIGAVAGEPANDLLGMARLFAQPVILGAFTLYFLSAVLWIYVLQHVPLTLAYPFMAFGFVLTPLIAAIILAEPLDVRYFAGMTLIIGGIYLASAPR